MQAALPTCRGMIAAQTTLPVIGVPVRSHALSGWDSLLSIVQMPGGIPVATTAVGNSGATNAGLLAVQMLSAFEPELATKLEDYRNELKEKGRIQCPACLRKPAAASPC